MILDSGMPILLATAFLLILAFCYRQFTSPLRDVPGPFLARFTRLWYLSKIWRGNVEQVLIDLHAKHGKVVRIAPNEYSIDDPEAVTTIYGRSSSFRKSDMYQAFEVPGSPSVFTMRSIRGHIDLRKKYHEIYTMTSVKSYERYVDDCIVLFLQKLNEASKSQNVVDVRKWLQFFAFDVIGAVATSEPFGVLEKGEDRESLIQTTHDILLMSSRLAVYSELASLLHRTMAFLGRCGIINLSNVAYISHWTEQLAEKRRTKIQERNASLEDQKEGADVPKDIMTKFIENHVKDPERFTWSNVVDMSIINITGGSDTISSTLSMVLFHLAQNPDTVAKMHKEMAEHEAIGGLSNPVLFQETQQLHYLRAVIKESLRLGSPFGFPFARAVPRGGADLCGWHFPAGSVVGIDPWVAHQNREVFGANASEFVPERWLKSQSDEATLGRMEHYFLAWGLGARTCLGRNIALMEIQKVLPQLLRNFDFELGPELKESGRLQTQNRQVVLVTNLFLRVRPRSRSLGGRPAQVNRSV